MSLLNFPFQAAMIVLDLCALLTLVCSVESLLINDFTGTVSTPNNDNTAYEDETFDVSLDLKFEYMSSDQSVNVQLRLPYSSPENSVSCDQMMTGESQNCRSTTTADVYATVDPSTVTATIGSNLVASSDPPGVNVISDGAIPQALVNVNFGLVHSTVDHSPDLTDVIAITIKVKIKPGFTIITHLFDAIATTGTERNETSVEVRMRGPFLQIVTQLEQPPYDDVEAGQRLYYSIRIDHLSGSTEDAIDGVVCILPSYTRSKQLHYKEYAVTPAQFAMYKKIPAQAETERVNHELTTDPDVINDVSLASKCGC